MSSAKRQKGQRFHANTAQKAKAPPSCSLQSMMTSPGVPYPRAADRSAPGPAMPSRRSTPLAGSWMESPRSRRRGPLGATLGADAGPALVDPIVDQGGGHVRSSRGRSAPRMARRAHRRANARSPFSRSCGWCRTSRRLRDRCPPAGRRRRCPYVPSLTSMASPPRRSGAWLAPAPWPSRWRTRWIRSCEESGLSWPYAGTYWWV